MLLKKEKVLVYEHAYDTYDNDVEYIMWTNDWIIIQDDEDFFALKCDKSGNVSEVDLSDNLSDFYDKLYIKMADGNIVVADAEDCILYKKYVDWLGENKSWKKQQYYWQVA